MIWSLFGLEGSQTQAQFFDKAGNRTANDLRGFRQKEVAAFVQDTFKVLPNLTLNYSLRYQFNDVPSEVNNLLSTLYSNPSGPAPFTFDIAADGKGLPPLYNNDWYDFEPRIGIAWDPFHRGKRPCAPDMESFTTACSGSCWDSRAGTRPWSSFSSRLFSAHQLRLRRRDVHSHNRFPLHFCALAHRFPRDFCLRR